MNKHCGYFTQIFHGKEKSYMVLECTHCGATVMEEDKDGCSLKELQAMDKNIPCCKDPFFLHASLETGIPHHKEQSNA